MLLNTCSPVWSGPFPCSAPVLPGASVLLLQSHVRAGPTPNITHIDGPARFAFELRSNRLRPSTLTLNFIETVRALRGEGAEESKAAS